MHLNTQQKGSCVRQALRETVLAVMTAWGGGTPGKAGEGQFLGLWPQAKLER